jgi:Domain of unknown function (DUF6864)
MKIITGGKEVIGSGTVISFGTESVQFVIDDKPKDMTIEFKFIDDPSVKGSITESKIIDESSLVMTFKNFNNSLGTGNVEPISIGTSNNRPLFLSYRIYALGSKGMKTIHYTWYLGEAIDG